MEVVIASATKVGLQVAFVFANLAPAAGAALRLGENFSEVGTGLVTVGVARFELSSCQMPSGRRTELLVKTSQIYCCQIR
jgi:hypothetical protein